MYDDTSTGEQPVCYNIGNITHSKATLIFTTCFPLHLPTSSISSSVTWGRSILLKCQKVYVNNIKIIWREQVVLLVKYVMVPKRGRKVWKDIRSSSKGTWHQLRCTVFLLQERVHIFKTKLSSSGRTSDSRKDSTEGKINEKQYILRQHT